MNRLAANVLFGAFGKIEEEAVEPKGSVRSVTPDEASALFDGGRSVIIVPGYGMAVVQARHAAGLRGQRAVFRPKCMMLFGDAKDSLTKLFSVLK